MAALITLPPPAGAQAGFTVLDAWTVDSDTNGHIDGVDVLFSQEVNPHRVVLEGVRLGSGYTPFIRGIEFCPGQGLPLDGCDDFSVLRILLEERTRPDTAAGADGNMHVRFARDSVWSRSGVVLPASTQVTVQDAAPPVLIAAYAQPGTHDVVMIFSEPVLQRNNGNPAAITPVPPEQLPPFFVLADDIPGQGPHPFYKSTTPNRQTPHHLGDRHIWLSIHPPPAGPSPPPGFDADDLGCDGARFNVTITTAGVNGIEDAAGNAPVPGSGSGPRVRVPCVEAAHADIGSDVVKLIFNGPITGVTAPALDVIRAADGNISGVEAVATSAGSTFALVTMDAEVVPSEVDTTPAFLRVRAGQVRGQFINIPIAEQIVPLVDVTPPRIVQTITRDLDSTGFVNAFEVFFTEPVDDTLDPAKAFIYTPGGWQSCDQLECRIDTGDVPLDDRLYVVFDETATQLRTDLRRLPDTPCTAGSCPPVTLPAIHFAEGAFRDLARNPAVNGQSGNPSPPSPAAVHTTLDGAPPRIIRAFTLDEAGDGYLDRYRIEFSEPVVRQSFNPQHWSVDGYDDVRIIGTGTNPIEISLLPRQAYPAFGNTGETPQIRYDPPSGQGLRDINGNIMLPFAEDAFPRHDSARPQFTAVFGKVGEPLIHVEFSEGVTAVGGGGLTKDHFLYASSSPRGATGVVSVQHTAGDRFVHLRLNDDLTAQNLAQDRIWPSTLSQFQIIEVGGTLTVDQDPARTPPRMRPFEDRIPPAAIPFVEVVQESITANSVKLRWVAPGDDGHEGGPVAGYEVKWDFRPITNMQRYLEAPDVDPQDMLFVPEVLAGPGEIQEVIVYGLKMNEMYHFSLRAYDNATPERNIAEQFSPSSAVQTLVDTTPPVGRYNVTLDSIAVTPDGRRVTFSWDPFMDPESTVIYRYATDQDPLRNLTADDSRTIETRAEVFVPWAPGTSYFLVQAESGGGPYPTHRATLIPPFPADADFYAAHEGMEVSATRERGVYRVSWTLPPQNSLPGDVVGMTIWRMPSTGDLTLVATLRGDYDTLRESSHADVTAGTSPDATYALAMEFRQRPGFPGLDSPPDVAQLPQAAVVDAPFIPWWVWLVLGVVAVLLLAGGGAYFLLRRPEDEWGAAEDSIEDTEYETADAEVAEVLGPTAQASSDLSPGEASAAPPPLPEHAVDCPKCGQKFTARGLRPLAIECPHCGVRGML